MKIWKLLPVVLGPFTALVLDQSVRAFEDPRPDPAAAEHGDGHAMPDGSFTLRTGIADGKMVFIGEGGDIDRIVNPSLNAHEGDLIQVTLINGEGGEHDIVFPDFHAASEKLIGPGASSSVVFRVGAAAASPYYCTRAGHREAGMEGRVEVGLATDGQSSGDAASIARDPADLPPPITRRAAARVRFDLEAIEREGRLDDHASYRYWTFDGKAPGPFLRVRVGDTVDLHLKNAAFNYMTHSIDLHAVNGPGGGAVFTQTAPGGEKCFVFKALTPGLYIYHCAMPMVAQHIANGMYGMILVEPPRGLPKVDREFYVMQGEIYSSAGHGKSGLHEFSAANMLEEKPDYFVFNGAVGALTKEHPLHGKVGEKIRIFFGDGGPNKTSSFHVIGQIFEHVYQGASLSSPPLVGVQTVTVPPGGASVVEFPLRVPGKFILVDHALSRMERGLAGVLEVTGDAQPDIFTNGGDNESKAASARPRPRGAAQ